MYEVNLRFETRKKSGSDSKFTLIGPWFCKTKYLKKFTLLDE